MQSFVAAGMMVLAATVAHGADALLVSETAAPGSVAMVAGKAAAGVVVDGADYKVVDIVANLFSEDVESVTGVKPVVEHGGVGDGGGVAKIYVGTLGHSPIVDALIKNQHVDISEIAGKWESYEIVPVGRDLLIVGSDRRGTAYGVLALSEACGVSPWEWWADVPAKRHESLYYVSGRQVHGPPSVKYRGIFLNDEDWGLQPWAAKTFEPETGDIGPKTYAKIFELLLRLHANFCWPAMHDVTKAFNLYPPNKQVADDYAIVMGSSHCEPMLRNNVTEWGKAKEPSFNYVTNREGVLNYWKQRVQENGKFENVYTLGMRGIHDSDMLGGGTPQERADRLNAIMKDQRELLREFVNPDVTQVPQIFCPYKEVLKLYQLGAVPPPDVTLVWADDNYGYIRQLATPAEIQNRGDKGGFGVYYHLSYWGRPHDYLWLCTTPPALVWEELSKAYADDARNLWVVNVGDLKPAEIDITLAMQMGYDMGAYDRKEIGKFLEDFSRLTFGDAHAAEIAAVLNEYYHLNFQRKPEHLGFNMSQNKPTTIQPTQFSDEEIAERLAGFTSLTAKANVLYEQMPREMRDAFYELVVYPVRGAGLQNEVLLNADMNRRATTAEAAGDYAQKSKTAWDALQAETAYFNDELAGGKWKRMMSDAPHKTDVFKLPTFGAGGGATPKKAAAMHVDAPAGATGFVEKDGYLSIAATHFTRKTDRPGAAWQVIPQLGRLGDSMAVFPMTASSMAKGADLATQAPVLEYAFETVTDAPKAVLTVQAVPTHRLNLERGLRYAVAIDDGVPQVVDLESAENSAVWDANVLRNSAFGVTTQALAPGKHTLRIYMVDPGVVLDWVTMDLGGLPKGYLPPGETWAGAKQ